MRNNIYYLQNRSILRISGIDSVNYINSLCTNSVVKLQNGNACYTCILTPKSKFLYDFFVYKIDENNLLIDIYSSFIDNFINTLNKYKLRNKFEIIRESDLQIVVSTNSKIDAKFSFIDTRHNNIGTRFVVKKNIIDNNTDYDDLLIENMVVAGEWLEQDKAFILEYNFESFNAIDFDKGCYIGQELITRVKRTGEIRKKIQLVENCLDDMKHIRSHSDKKLYLILSSIQE